MCAVRLPRSLGTSHDQRDDLLVGSTSGDELSDSAPAPQHDGAVGDLHDVIHGMRDDDHSHVLGAQPQDQIEHVAGPSTPTCAGPPAWGGTLHVEVVAVLLGLVPSDRVVAVGDRAQALEAVVELVRDHRADLHGVDVLLPVERVQNVEGDLLAGLLRLLVRRGAPRAVLLVVAGEGHPTRAEVLPEVHPLVRLLEDAHRLGPRPSGT